MTRPYFAVVYLINELGHTEKAGSTQVKGVLPAFSV